LILPKPGDRIKAVAGYWARGRQHGQIIDPAEKGLSEVSERFCIYFVKAGIGIEDRILFLDEKDFEVVE